MDMDEGNKRLWDYGGSAGKDWYDRGEGWEGRAGEGDLSGVAVCLRRRPSQPRLMQHATLSSGRQGGA